MIKKIAAISILLTCSCCVNAAQCPPGSALRHDTPNKAWLLDQAYIAQGWELVYQSPKLLNSYLTFVPPGMTMFVNLSEYDAWTTRCVYYAPLDNPREKTHLVVQSKHVFDANNIFQPKFTYQPSTLTHVCQTTAGNSSSCSWL